MTTEQSPQETITGKWSRLYGTLYHFLGQAMLDHFGDAGEAVLRRAVHDYGAYRAGWMRAHHQARGLALNLANLHNLGDMPNTDSLEKEGRICTPSYFRVTVTECTHNDTWRALDGLRAGRIYCEEVHHPLYCEYADGVTLELPDFLTKGDDFCTFILTQPNAPEPAAQPVPDAHPEAKIARLYGVLYCFLGQAMLDAFGDEGERALRQALTEYARHAAGSLNEDQLARGWELRGSALQLAEGYASIAGQAVYDAWREVEGDETPIGLIYFQEIHRPTQSRA
jgi:hypothetical protein